MSEWTAPDWVVLILSTHGEERLPFATRVLERMYTELGHLKRAGSLENFYCIYELYPDDPHIDFGLKTSDAIPEVIR